ncbi:MAG: hypothetical protein OXF79_15330 [Chloroflexi bacterium]|nr:hypothetical protein [Chloroflexota bacterium]
MTRMAVNLVPVEKPVFMHRLIVKNTVDAAIRRMQEHEPSPCERAQWMGVEVVWR